MRLVWSDEFEAPAGAPPDPRWWRHEVGGHGRGNGELQRYTEPRTPPTTAPATW